MPGDRGSPSPRTRALVRARLARHRAQQPDVTAEARGAVEARLAAAEATLVAEADGIEGEPAFLLSDVGFARLIAPLFRGGAQPPTPGPLGLILMVIRASDVPALADDLGLSEPPAGPGLPLLFDVDGHRGSRRVLACVMFN